MFTISCPPKVVWLGREGENEFRTIEVEVSEWLREYPNGTISVVYHRPDDSIYVPTVTTSGNITRWLITSTDTSFTGRGEAEFRIIDGDIIGKSVKMPTMVSDGINATTDDPESAPADWTVEAGRLQNEIDGLDDRVTELEQHGGGGEGTSDHTQLTNRAAANQHPISAITGLQTALDGKQPSGDYATSGELDALADIVDGKADAADIPAPYDDSELRQLIARKRDISNSYDKSTVDTMVGAKQDIITDLDSIRSGAALGATALQSVPNTYRTATAQDAIDNGKQDKLIAGANITIAADGKTISATGGGGEPFVVNITVNSGGAFSADKTNAEIYAAVQANKVVYAVVGENRMQLVSATSAKAVFADTMKTNKVRNGAITIANNAVTATETILQSESITDVGNYYATDTVEGALQEIGSTLNGVETALHNVNTILGGAL